MSHVRDEVLTEGKRGTAALSSFVEKVSVREPPADTCKVATLEWIAAGDAGLVLLADERGVTTLLLESAKNGDLTADVLYELIEAGRAMSARVYSQVRRRLQESRGR